MQELHFTKRDIRLRIAEGKRLFWQRLDGRCKDTARALVPLPIVKTKNRLF